MDNGRNDNPTVRSVERPATRDGTRARSTARVNERLIEQLCQLGREIVHEPVPQHLIDIVRASKTRRRRE